MSGSEPEEIHATVCRWRAAHPTAAARRVAYLQSVPKQVADSMAFEGERVDLEMLEDHLKVLLCGDPTPPDTSTL
jgi:hypothetical protein